MPTTARVISIVQIPPRRIVVNNRKDHRKPVVDAEKYTYLPLNGGGGQFIKPLELVMELEVAGGRDKVDVSGQFRARFGPRLSLPRVKAILKTQPTYVEIEECKGKLRVTNEVVDAWFARAQSSNGSNGHKKGK